MKKALKRSLSLLLAITIIFSSAYVGLSEVDFNGLFAVKANAASVNDLTFTLNDDGISYSVTDCKISAKGELVIPDIYNGLPVTSIGDYAFYACTSLTDVIIPDSVISIGSFAFDNTSYYNDSSNWENNVLYIGNHLIKVKTSLSGEYTIKDGTKTIADSSFKNCTSLTSITIPDSVISIGGAVFEGCTSLTSITIPDSVTSIGASAFYNCTKLTSITIPDSVTHIANSAFYNCESLTTITIGDSVTSIGGYAFYNCGRLASITIPNSVTSIGGAAFYNCASLTSIIIPDSVTSIGNVTFENCYGLTRVTIGDSVTSIGASAFYNCGRLATITIPDSVTSIGQYAFYNCYDLNAVYITDIAAWCNIDFYSDDSNPLYYANKLYINGELATNVVIPDGVTSVGDYAFRGCTNLTSITIPDSVTSIGYYAFEGCTSLTSVIIPDSVTSIEGFAFWGCKLLTSVTIGDNITSIGEYVFNETGYCYEGSNWENDVLYIGNYLIKASESLSGKYTIKEGTRIIAGAAFEECTSLTSVIIPDSVTSIGDFAFNDCTNLTNITIPSSVAYIGYMAFDDAPVTICCYPNSFAVEYCQSNNYKYKYITFCVEYDYNYEGATAQYQYKNFNEPISLFSTTPTRSGYEFLGWSTTKNGAVEFMPGQTYSENADIVLYAVWREYEHYVITYNANGGVSTPPEQEKVEFKNIILSNDIPERPPFVFEGWSTTQNGEVKYMPGDIYSEDQSITLYAKWKLQCDNCDSTGKISKKCSVCSGDGILQDSCTKCNGKGGKTVDPCSACGGDGGYKRVTCSLCGGDGIRVIDTAKCPECEGKGYTPSIYYDCPKCDGSGKNWQGGNCSWCYGTGEYHETCFLCKGEGEVYREGECYRCDGSGKYTTHCSICGGDGKEWQDCSGCVDGDVDCSSCNKTGWEYKDKTCPKCNGSGELSDNYTGIIKYDGNTYYLENGCVSVCKHLSTKWVIDKTATVSAPGTKHKECTVCGEVLETATIPQLKPATPKVATTNEIGGVQVTWNKVAGATKYVVYRRQGGYNTWVNVGTTTGNTLLDKNVKSGIYYVYSVRAYNNTGAYSDFVSANTQTRKFIATPKLTTIYNHQNGLAIKWNAVDGITKGYRVYRRGAGSTYWTYLGTTKNLYFIDNAIKNKSGEYFRYTVIADGDYHSKFDTTGLYLKRLANPTLTSAVSSKSGITVKWGAVKGTTGYYVYRKTANSTWTRVGTVGGTNNTTFLDKTAKKGVTYTYTVKAVYGATTSGYYSGISCYDKY